MLIVDIDRWKLRSPVSAKDELVESAKMRKNFISWTVFLAASTLFFSCQKEQTYRLEIKDGIRHVHNLKPKNDKPAAGLEFSQQIGELEAKDENYLFAFPISVAEGEQGNIYILDTKDGCVKKFSAAGQYLLRFGRNGEGPGEFQYPQTIDVSPQGRLFVSTMSSHFHLFDLSGQFIDRLELPRYQGLFPKYMNSGQIVAYSMNSTGDNSPDNKILKIYDGRGNIVREFGEPFLVDKTRSSWVANFLHLTVDSDDNIYAVFIHQNRIEKYSEAGRLLMTIDRTLPFKLEYGYKKETMDIGGSVRTYDAEDFPLVALGIGVDGLGRIWVLALRKEIPKDIQGEEFIPQDYLVFEVYGEDGVLLFHVPFPAGVSSFDNMTMHGDHLFFADPHGQACVYEYKVVDIR
jgi:hypothetical protein